MEQILTTSAIAALQPCDRRREFSDGVVPGLFLVLQPSGAKSWALRYRHNGRTRKLTLGPAALKTLRRGAGVHIGQPLTLEAARELAFGQLQLVRMGADPAARGPGDHNSIARARQEAIADVVDDFMAKSVRPNAKPGYAREVERLLRKEVLPHWGERSIEDVRKRDVIRLLDAIVERGGGITANRTLAALRRLFNWCVERDLLRTSPAEGVKPPLLEQVRERVLSDGELQHFWRAAISLGYPFRHLFQLLLLTGQRRQEVAGMRGSELSADFTLWTIPAARTKNGRTHEVPLSTLAASIAEEAAMAAAAIQRLKSHNGDLFVLTTTGDAQVSGFSRAKARLDEAMLTLAREAAAGRREQTYVEPPDWRIHDLRRTAASGMARARVPLPVIEKTLNHVSGSFAGIVSVYQRHSYLPEKREALETWAHAVTEVVSA